MANPFAYEEYRREKIRQKIEETRAQRVQLKVNPVNNEYTSGKTILKSNTFLSVSQRCNDLGFDSVYDQRHKVVYRTF